jgi:hypothetical protein
MPKLYDPVRTLVDVETLRHGKLPAGAIGVIVDDFHAPNEYAIDLEVPAPELVGGKSFANVALHPDQFTVIDDGSLGPNDGPASRA